MISIKSTQKSSAIEQEPKELTCLLRNSFKHSRSSFWFSLSSLGFAKGGDPRLFKKEVATSIGP